MRDVLGLQSEIAAAIATEIKVAVTPDESRRLKKTARSVDPAAHVLLLQAQSLLQQRNTSREAVDQAQGFLQQAVALQPDYAEAYAQLATAYNTKASVGYMSMRDAGPIVQGFVEQALRLDPDLGPAYAARAQSRFLQQWDWAGAEADYKRAIELSPGDGSIHDRYSEFLSCLGRHDEALREGRLALDLSPLDIGTRARYGQALIFARRFDEAEAFLRKSLAIFPDDVFLTFTLGFALTGAGRYEEAIPVFLARKVPTADTNWSLGFAYGRAGRKAEARKVLEYLLPRRRSSSSGPPSSPLSMWAWERTPRPWSGSKRGSRAMSSGCTRSRSIPAPTPSATTPASRICCAAWPSRIDRSTLRASASSRTAGSVTWAGPSHPREWTLVCLPQASVPIE
jgi:tetratricopeptide (TPR) repeat protein